MDSLQHFFLLLWALLLSDVRTCGFGRLGQRTFAHLQSRHKRVTTLTLAFTEFFLFVLGQVLNSVCSPQDLQKDYLLPEEEENGPGGSGSFGVDDL